MGGGLIVRRKFFLILQSGATEPAFIIPETLTIQGIPVLKTEGLLSITTSAITLEAQ